MGYDDEEVKTTTLVGQNSLITTKTEKTTMAICNRGDEIEDKAVDNDSKSIK